MKILMRSAIITVGLSLCLVLGATGVAAAAPTGSITVNLTQPRVVSGSAQATVNCATHGTIYRVRAHRSTIDGHRIAASMVIRNYAGPGSYKATVRVALRHGRMLRAGTVRNVQVTVTAGGGTWTFAGIATGKVHPGLAGKAIAGTISYACSQNP